MLPLPSSLLCLHLKADAIERGSNGQAGIKKYGKLFVHGQIRAPQCESPDGERNEKWKCHAFYPLESGTVCAPPDQYWHYFEGSHGEIYMREQSPYGHFQVQQFHLEMKKKLNWKYARSLRATVTNDMLPFYNNRSHGYDHGDFDGNVDFLKITL